MDYEKKYKEALERAKDFIEKQNPPALNKEFMAEIFPELKESEDERIRKELICFLNTEIPQCEARDKYTSWLEKQGKGKLTDKPKFKIGDWIVQENVGVYKVIEVCESWYEVIDNKDKHYSIGFDKEYMCHLWTTNDAKDGDVLVNGSNIFIFHFIYGTRLMGYCHVNIDDGRFYDDIGKNECFCLIDAVVNPTTKEQRDTLMKAMADAGYTFDFEKKELKKIKQKPAWSKDDEKIITGIINDIQKRLEDYPLEQLAEIYFKEIKWLKSIKDRVQPEQEWNEEDEKMLNSFLHKVEVCNLLTNKENVWIVKKLKSLKPQPHWKPSDKQITVLELASKYERVFMPKQIDILIGLKEQLKKLRGE